MNKTNKNTGTNSTSGRQNTHGKTAEPHYTGHRQRLRDKFMRAGGDALNEYELLELVLFRAIQRSDVKPLAKTLLETFGDLSSVIGAPVERLKEIPGVNERVATDIKVIEAVARKLGQSRIMHRKAIASWDDLIAYCRTTMAEKTKEEFRVLFLDRQNRLIGDELVSSGTVDHTPVYPREVMKRCLDLSASAIILVHNHPSGNPKPSQADIDMTNQLNEIAKGLGIILHDHLIIARSSEASFKTLGLL